MGKNKYLNCKISAIAYYLPESIMNNIQLAERFDGWDENKIYEKTGIRKRHVAGANEHVSDLAYGAAMALFGEGNLKREEIDALILCTQTPDYAFPATSAIIHERLGLPKSCASFDFNQGCTGFIYGLSIAGSMIHSGIADKVLLITAETYSRWCHHGDRSVATLFGDGGAAIYIRHIDGETGMGPFIFGTDGRGFKNLIVPSSGSHTINKAEAHQEFSDKSGNIRTLSNLYMNGPEMFRFTMQEVPLLVENLLQRAKCSLNDIDKFVFHQANAFMLKNLQAKLNIPDSKMIYEMEDIGNTVSASIPIAIKRAFKRGSIAKKNKLLLVGFGVGYSWAGNLITWDPD